VRPGPLLGRSIVLTGASAGIGRALALALARRGARLALAARDETRLHEVAGECRARGGQALVARADVGVEDDCRALVERCVEAYGGLDVLVNNAGASMWARLDELRELSLYAELMRVNYLGCVYATYHALPHLKRARGRIVVVSSLAGLTGVPTRTGYAASKHALFGFFDSLRIELQGTGVSVTMVAPDFVVSEIHQRSLGPDGKPLGRSPMQEGRLMTAERCAELIVRAAERRQRLAITSWRGRVGRWVRLFAPGLIDGIARRAVARGR
jgi:NAD(P)-dependent dehydrogenase (short-subunit alcohol dehydrogenase family)